MNIISRWPLHIYGAQMRKVKAAALPASVVGTKDLSSRWSYLIDEYGAKVFVTDHLQQYSFDGGFISDYEKQIRTISAVVRHRGRQADRMPADLTNLTDLTA